MAYTTYSSETFQCRCVNKLCTALIGHQVVNQKLGEIKPHLGNRKSLPRECVEISLLREKISCRDPIDNMSFSKNYTKYRQIS